MLTVSTLFKLFLLMSNLLNLIEAYNLEDAAQTTLSLVNEIKHSGLQRPSNSNQNNEKLTFDVTKRRNVDSDIFQNSPILRGKADRRHRREVKRDVFFPGQKTYNSVQSTVPRCIKSENGVCTKAENYPNDIIQRVLKVDGKKYVELFGEDEVPEAKPDLVNRFDDPDEETLCQSSVKLIFPQAGLTKDNNWNFIINQENYTQGIRIEECINPGKPCSMTDSFPNNFTTECRQKFIYRQLVGMNTEGKVVKDLFQIPSCCICILKSSSNRSRREVFKKF